MEEIQDKVARLPAHPKRCRPGRVEGTWELVVRPNYTWSLLRPQQW